MGSLQQPGRYISSYANGSQRAGALQNQGGFPQSLSGSETDVSTSNENLSHEERYVIQHTARQEPQGQEQTSSQQHLQNSGNGGQQQQHQRQASRGSIKDGTTIPSNRSSLDVSSSSYNTLIIHGAGDEPWTGRLSGIRDRVDVNCSPLSFTSDKRRASSASPAPALSMGHQTGVTDINDIPDDYLSDSHVLKHLAKEVATKTPSSQQPSPNAASPAATRDSGVSENVDLDRLSIGGKGIITHSLDYEALRAKWRHRGASGKFPALSSLSKSQPDLSKVGGNGASETTSAWRVRSGVSSAPRPRTRGREDGICGGDIWPQSEMVDILVQENGALKLDLENLYQKVAKTQKLEQEIAKVHRAHEDLAASCERRERLERAARSRLHADCRRLQELNAALREHADLLQAQLTAAQASVVGAGVQHEGDANVLRKEISRREVLIAQLITQNKELVAAKERQEIELAAQRATLQEQRTHIDILDTALTNAQGNVVRLEEECRKKQMYVERVAQLQRALSSLQLASDRREQTERKLRLQLERELRSERARPGDDSPGLSLTGEASAAELKRRLRERDEKIMRLEGECAKWEQRYLEESALRQAAIDAASIPKDAKIAALEKTSQDAEKLIAEARSEKIRHMDEVHAAQKKVADLESKVKDYESKLAERDAMIRVLQKHAYDKDSGAVVGSRSPHHTPHASLHGAGTTATDLVLGTAVSREELVSSVLTGSTGFGSTTSYAGSSSGDSSSYGHHHHRGASSATKICHGLRYGSAATDADTAYDTTKRALDDQLKELDSQLDSQLLGKRGLCCFPGFASAAVAANAASQRKNKIPKPLLAAVGGNGGTTGGGGSGSGGGGSQATSSAAGFLQGLVAVATSASSVSGGSSNKPEEMLLLEKQGRSSQQQRTVTGADVTSASQRSSDGRKRDDRSGSLPPSSLPRPPRSTRSGISQPRKFGDYGRLQNDDTSSGGRKKSDGGDSISSGGSIGSSNNSKRQSPARSLIPPPRKLGEYGRLGGSSSPILRSKLPSQSQQQQQCMSARSSAGERDSASTLSDNSATSLPPPSKLRLYGGSPTGTTSRRGSSLGRDGNKTDSGSGSKFRIQF